jgi:hypothetical protein
MDPIMPLFVGAIADDPACTAALTARANNLEGRNEGQSPQPRQRTGDMMGRCRTHRGERLLLGMTNMSGNKRAANHQWYSSALLLTIMFGCNGVVTSTGGVGEERSDGGAMTYDAGSVAPVPQVDGGQPGPTGEFVTPLDLGSLVGLTSPPKEILSGDRSIDVPGSTLEDVTVNGCLTVNADNVTIRNVTINCSSRGYPIKTNSTSGFVIERSKIDCDGTANKGMYFAFSSDFTVDGVEITGCDDQFFIDGGLGDSTIQNSVFHNQAPADEAHTDGMQVGEFETTSGRLTVSGNWWEYNRDGCCENAVLFATSYAELTINIHSNYLDGDFGTHVIRCNGTSTCQVDSNTLGGEPEGLFVYAGGSTTSFARCNVLPDGTNVPEGWYDDLVAVDDTGCP